MYKVSFLAISGVPPKDQLKIMGHEDIIMTLKYVYIALTHLKGAMELLGEKMLHITI